MRSATKPTESATSATGAAEVGHTHADVSGGWLRASVFGAMDGLVTSLAIVAGVAGAGASAHTVLLAGLSGLVAGAFSMALGEWTSVSTQGEQLDHEVAVERREILAAPAAEQAELATMLQGMGMSQATARAAAAEIHADPERATQVHVAQELGLDPHDKPSPSTAAWSSFVCFALGAAVPLLPYLLGVGTLRLGLLSGALGLLLAGALAARFTVRAWWYNALRQLAFGALAAGATYCVGLLIGAPAA